MNSIMDASPETAEWLRGVEPSKWALSYDDGARYGHMTTNMMESCNGVLKEIRNLPITALVQGVFGRMVEVFNQQRARLDKDAGEGYQYTKYCTTIMEHRIAKASSHAVTLYDAPSQIYHVVTAEFPMRSKGGNQHAVYLDDRRCDCGKYQQSRIPCSHAIACIQSYVGTDPYTYVDPYYRIDVARQTYNGTFHPVRHRHYWPPMRGKRWTPNPAMIRKKGRPKSTRIRNEMDWKEPTTHTNACKKCNQPGHNSRTCTNVPRNAGESSRHVNRCKKCKEYGHNSRTCKYVPPA